MKTKKPNALIVGGTSGLGLELALLLVARTYNVFVTGRNEKKVSSDLHPFQLNLGSRRPTALDLDRLLEVIPPIDLLVWAAAFEERRKIADLADKDIDDQLAVGLRAPAMLLARLLRKQRTLPGFIAITSTSQVRPRLYESIYCAAKAGLGMFAWCASLDEAVKKVLVIAPAGMNTPFWRGSPRADKADLLDPRAVAAKTMHVWKNAKKKFQARLILRNPMRVVPFMKSK